MGESNKAILAKYHFYGVRYIKDFRSLERSTSGGAFFGIAEALMEQGYYVCAAILDCDFKVKHIISREKNDLEWMQGSKYVQSDLGDSFRAIKDLLSSGEKVFFCGCPCQVSGLQKYIQSSNCDANLVTMDFACHGVASQKVLDSYLEWQCDVGRRPIEGFVFRDKNNRWGHRGKMWRYLRLNGRLVSSATDPLAMAYLSHSNYRESCYRCKCKFPDTTSDFTVGDFVKADKFFPGVDNSQGLSILFCATEKAKSIWTEICSSFWYKKIPANEYIGFNSGLWDSSSRPKERDSFYYDLDKKGAAEFFGEYRKTHLNIKKRIEAILDRCC